MGEIKYMIDPLKRTEEIEKDVCRNLEKKYFRFRATKFYGGISTADCVGCNIVCLFCWNFNRNQRYKQIGNFYSPEEVSKKLIEIADENGYEKLRITGGEPTLGREHLLEVLERIPENYRFILETNSILLGANKNYVKELSSYNNLHVRVSLKGSNKEEFSKLTQAEPKYFNLQLKALENLKDENIRYHASVMSLKDDLSDLKQKLVEIDPSIWLEKEELKLYSTVKKRMKKAGLV